MEIRSDWRVGALVVLLLLTSPAAAIVNTEDTRVKEPEAGFSGQFSLAVAGQSGNTEKSSTSLGGRLQWHYRPLTDFIVINHDSGKTGGVRDTNRSFVHARHIHELTPKLAWETFGQAEENEFTRLSFRGLLGGGVRREAFRSDDGKLVSTAGLGGFISREELDPLAGTTDAGVDTLVRGNFYFVVKYQLNETVRLASTTYYQPATSDFRDYRALEQATLHVNLTRRLDLKISLDVAHDNRPPQLIEKTDTTYRTGIEFQF